jgi:hypothetical protein
MGELSLRYKTIYMESAAFMMGIGIAGAGGAST